MGLPGVGKVCAINASPASSEAAPACSRVTVGKSSSVCPVERDAVERAKPVSVADQEIRFCTPEDLILLKLISKRDQDLADVQGILRRRFPDLDLDYLEPRAEELSTLLPRPEIWQNWSEWKSEPEESP